MFHLIRRPGHERKVVKIFLLAGEGAAEMSAFVPASKYLHQRASSLLQVQARPDSSAAVADTLRISKEFFAGTSSEPAIPHRRFSEALTASSQQYEKLHPSMAGPTMKCACSMHGRKVWSVYVFLDLEGNLID
jgi:hypothetical protein